MLVRQFVMTLVLAFIAVFAQRAQAFFDPPWITPTNPVAGDVVSVNIRTGQCDSIFEETGFPQLTREGNSIRLLEYGVHDAPPDFCIYPTGTLIRPLGSLAPGDYSLAVDLAYQHPIFGPSIFNIGVVNFSIAAPPAPTPVPALSLLGAAALTLILLVAAIAHSQRRRKTLFLIGTFFLVGLPPDTRAQDTQTIEIALSSASGSPTPQQLVSWANSSPRSPSAPLQAFTNKAPLRVDYLIPDRATGDFLAWLNANPQSARKKLEDSTIATFFTVDISSALSALQADPNVASAIVVPQSSLHSVELTDFDIVPEGPLGGNDQYGWFDMNLDAAWRLAGGYALVGQVDNGLFVEHPALRQFNGGAYVGGNFIKAASRDVGLTGRPAQASFDPTDVDEKKKMWIEAGSCTSTASLMEPDILGHGTHVAGLLGANGASGQGVQGTCKHCGIAMWRAKFLVCNAIPPVMVIPTFNDNAARRAQAQVVDNGVQVESLSFGLSSSSPLSCSTTYRNSAMCQVIDYAQARDVPMVASSGNRRAELDFPASDTRVVSTGGFQESLAFWDDSPGSPTNCPPSPYTSECGSNFSKLSSGHYFTHQEVLGSAKHVLSTTYPNTTWMDYAECGDGYGTAMGDGLGWCTGTSMSAPQIAGVIGLLRSINPLVPQSKPEPPAGQKPGLRTVLAQTASRSGAWDAKLGYGIPDAAAAARKVLGTVAGATVRNRVTPLFRLWQATTKDFADTGSPQYALSLMINQDKNYIQPSTGLGAQLAVPGYTFPYDVDDPADSYDSFDTTPPAAPRAAIYVLTTEYRPRNQWPDLLPLHLMDKNAPGGKDYLLATTVAEIEAAHAAGYNLRTIQGYIYQPCTPEPACIPPDA